MLKKLAVFAASALLATVQAHAQAPADPTEASYVLTGFRSADFGVDEDALRAAIRNDFGKSGDDVRAIDNDIQQTKALIVSVEDLLPDSGVAQVSYILGYQSKALTQVSVIWGGAVDEAVDARALVAMANQLRIHFAGQGYAVEAANAPIAQGVIIIFRGRDATGRMTLLTLDAPPTPEGAEQPPRRPSLQLVYMDNPDSPDVFQVDTGAF